MTYSISGGNAVYMSGIANGQIFTWLMKMEFTDIKILTLVFSNVVTFHCPKRILLSKIATSVQTLNILWICCNKCTFFSVVKLIVHKVEVESNFIFNYRKFSLSAGKEDLRRQLCTLSPSFSPRSTASSRWGCRRSRSARPRWSSPRGRRPSCSRTSPGPCRAPRWSWSRRGCARWATGSRPQPRDNAPRDKNYDEMLRKTLTFLLTWASV